MKNENFLEQLILKANPDIDDSGLEMMISDATPVLQEWVFTNIVAKLDEEWRKELVKITEWWDYKSWAAYKYLESKIDWYENFISEVYEKFEEMYLKNFREFLKD